MAKIAIKSGKLTPFGWIFSIMGQFSHSFPLSRLGKNKPVWLPPSLLYRIDFMPATAIDPPPA